MKGKFIIINLKKGSIFAVIISSIFILFLIEAKLDNKLKSAVLVYNNAGSLLTYTTAANNVSYNLPKTYDSNAYDYSSGKVIHDNEFKSEDGEILGFIQVVKDKIDLKEAIKNKELITKKSIDDSYNVESLEINNLDSLEVSYEFSNDYGNEFQATEYFVKIKDGYVKCSFFTPLKEFNGKIESICRAIVNTLKVQ